jgi:hypothetical protein
MPASRSNLRNAYSIALLLLLGALPIFLSLTIDIRTVNYAWKSDTRTLVVGSDGIRNEVIAIHPARTKTTVVRNEKTPFNRCNVVYIFPVADKTDTFPYPKSKPSPKPYILDLMIQKWS